MMKRLIRLVLEPLEKMLEIFQHFSLIFIYFEEFLPYIFCLKIMLHENDHKQLEPAKLAPNLSLFSNCYAIIGPGKLYGVDPHESFISRRKPNGVELRRGVAKGVRIVRNTDGTAIPSVLLDCNFLTFFL